MKRILPSILFLVFSASVYSQNTTDTVIKPIESRTLQGPREATEAEKEYAKRLAEDREQQAQIANNLPPVDINSQTVTPTISRFANPYYYPYSWWSLHQGLNVNLSASVFANLGDSPVSGAGFAQDVSLMYVSNLSSKATLAVGGYLNNTTFGGENYTVAGVNALFAYRFNENWSAYAFVQKAFNSNNVAPWFGGYGIYAYTPYSPYNAYDLGNRVDTRFMDRIGGGVTYQWGEDKQNVISLNVEFDRLPNRRDDPWRR